MRDGLILTDVTIYIVNKCNNLIHVTLKDEAEDIKKQLEAPTCNQVALASLQQQVKELEQQAQEVKKLEQQKEWDEYYMKIACLAALRSKDPSTPVRLVQHIGIIYMYCTL